MSGNQPTNRGTPLQPHKIKTGKPALAGAGSGGKMDTNNQSITHLVPFVKPLSGNRPTFFQDLEFGTSIVDGGYQHREYCHNIEILVTKIHQNGKGLTGELYISAPDQNFEQRGIVLNFGDYQARQRLAQSLAADFTGEPIPIHKILNYVVSETIEREQYAGETEDIGTEPETKKIEYMVEPLLPMNMPTTIFSPGGLGKSIFADYLAVILSHGMNVNNLPIMTRQANILYLDWEADADQHRRYISAIKAGMGITDYNHISYLSCDRPFYQIKDDILERVHQDDIELVIIDSMMAATAGYPQGMNEAEIASSYYNDLRCLGITSLTIDHVTKAAMSESNGNSAPYGSVVKYNRSRSQFELKAASEPGENHIEYALVHKKFNLGRKIKPMGIAVDFNNNAANELTSIVFSPCDIADNPELAEKALTQQERIAEFLKGGKASLDEIAENTGIHRDICRVVCNKYKDKRFTKIGDDWGLLIIERNVTP